MFAVKNLIAFFVAFVTFIMGLFGLRTDNIQYKDLSYGDEYIQNMDVYYPETTDGAVGAFLLIHGGFWSAGYKEMYSLLASNLAKEGFVAATMNYRKFPQGATYTDMLADIEAALRTLKEKTLSDAIEVSKVALYGDSSGGHLSLLYAYRYAALAPIPVAFCVGRVTPVDLFDPALYYGTGAVVSPLVLSQLLGVTITPGNMEAHRAEIEAASPITYVSENVVPTILAYGGEDTLVPASNCSEFKNLLASKGVPHAYFDFANSGHHLDSEQDASVAEDFNRALMDFAAIYF